ncbi:MAG: cytochrome c-type biogenesis protein [Sulfitobacter sp.]
MKHLVLILVLLAGPAVAVEPDEVLSDPVLETRARALSKGLRCLVCRNESIDESTASLAKDLRLLVRERLVAGDSDTAAVAFIVARYGEYVLLKPTRGGANWILWAAGPLMLLLAGSAGVVYVRGRSRALAPQDEGLSAQERAILDDILNK